MARNNENTTASESVLQAARSAALAHGALIGAIACALAWALLVRFSGLMFPAASTVSQSGILSVASLGGLFLGSLLIPWPRTTRSLKILAALGAIFAAASTIFLGLPLAHEPWGPALYGACGLAQGIAYAIATTLAITCYNKLGFRRSLVVAAIAFTLALAAFLILGALLPREAAGGTAILPPAAALLCVLGWRCSLAKKPPAPQPLPHQTKPTPPRAILVVLFVLAGLLVVYMPAMYPKTTNLAPQMLGASECLGLISWRCVAALVLVGGLLWLAVGISHRRRAAITGATLLALALFAAIFFLLPSMGTSAAAFVLFVACGVLAALFSTAFLIYLAGQGSNAQLRLGLGIMTGGGLIAGIFAYIFLGPLYNVTLFQDTLFSVVPAVLLIAFVGVVFVLRRWVIAALGAWEVWSGTTPAPLGGEALAFPTANKLEAFAAHYGLTKREFEVLSLLAEGRNEPYVESTLGISRTTVKTHITHIYRKVGVSSRQQLIDVLRG